jgi:tocopherol cyclase
MFGYAVRRVFKSEIFQGGMKKKEYFEGWYFKLVDESENNVYAVIPGVSMGGNREAPYAFIQIINGKSHKSDYFTFAIKEFTYSKYDFEINIEKNYFSCSKIILNIDNNDIKVIGELNFTNLTKWPVSLLSPGIMGWYSFVPFMECYHGCLSLCNSLSGSLMINDEIVDFTRGIGYIEKDWGKSFPSSWIWAQCNHFDNRIVSIMASIANIPWLHKHFRGFIVGIMIDNKFYKFATYTGAKLDKIILKDNIAQIRIYDKKYELNLEISGNEGGQLFSPINGSMIGVVKESITSTIYVSLYEIGRKNKRKIYEGTGRNSGLEMMGNLSEIT